MMFSISLAYSWAVCDINVEGNRYTITGLRYAKHADQTALQWEESMLTLFVKNIYSFEYLIIFAMLYKKKVVVRRMPTTTFLL